MAATTQVRLLVGTFGYEEVAIHPSLFLRMDIRFHPLITFARKDSSEGNPARKEHVLMLENTLPAVLCF